MTEPSRYDQLSPLARALVDDYDALDLAEMLVKAQDELAAHRAAYALDAPLRDQLQAAVKALGKSETELARLRGQPAPAATEATEHHYLSTGCLHGQHDYCQSHTGQAGAKTPAQCKFCQAPCTCPCHKENPGA